MRFGTPPFRMFSEREDEHLRPHGSIDIVEEKPISSLGRRNPSFWEPRFFQSYKVIPLLGTMGGGPLVSDRTRFLFSF